MTEPAWHKLVEEHWSALEARPTTGEHRLRVSHLPVTTGEGPIAAAVDHEGHHHLLVPVHSRTKVRSGLDGPVLRLRKRPLEDEETYQTYADLACLRNDFEDLFTKLCADVLSTVREAPEHPVKGMYRVLDRWKALFQTQGAALGPEQLAGLFGELLVLDRLLQRDPGAHRLWVGPKGHRHDFSTGLDAIEVKTAVDPSGRRPRIHGLDQLEPPLDGSLHLVWVGLHRMTASGGGTGFVELVERTLQRCDDESALCSVSSPRRATAISKPIATGTSGSVSGRRRGSACSRVSRIDRRRPRRGRSTGLRAGRRIHHRPHGRGLRHVDARRGVACGRAHHSGVRLMEVSWYSQPYPPEGASAAEGIRNQLGRPELDLLTILVRESAQNSWDARLPDSSTPVDYGIDMWTVTPAHAGAWRTLLPAGAPRTPTTSRCATR